MSSSQLQTTTAPSLEFPATPQTEPPGDWHQQPLSLRTNFSWTLVGNASYAVCQWAMLVVLTKLCSTVMVGQFALALAITGPVFVFAGLNLRTVQVTDARRDFRFADYLGLRLLSVAAGVTFVVGLEVFSRHGAHLFLVILMAAAAKSFDLVGDVIFGLLQQHERMNRIAISQMLRGALQLAALTAVAWATRNVLWAVMAQAAASLVALAAYDAPNAARILPPRNTGQSSAGFSLWGLGSTSLPAQEAGLLVRQADFVDHAKKISLSFRGALFAEESPCGAKPGWGSKMRSLIRLSFPLGLVAMLGSLMVNIPRYFIEHSAGMTALAIYSAMGYIMSVGGMATGALLQAAAPRLARYYVEDLARFRKLLLQLVGIAAANGVLGIAGAALFGRWFLTAMYRPEYAKYPSVFTWLTVAAAVSYLATALACGVSAVRRFDVQLVIYLVSMLGTLCACAFLVPRFGLPGAAFSVTIGMTVWCVGFALVILDVLRVNQPEFSTASLAPFER